MKASIIAAATALAVTAPVAVAQVGTPNLSKREARVVILKDFPDNAPRLMLQDSRADFFFTQVLRVVPAQRCVRMSATKVSCPFTARLRPDKAHIKKHWFPIACVGSTRVEKMEDASYKGTMGRYVCRTILPKKK